MNIRAQSSNRDASLPTTMEPSSSPTWLLLTGFSTFQQDCREDGFDIHPLRLITIVSGPHRAAD